MPELPDIEVYLHALRPRLLGQRLSAVRVAHPFLVRTVDPPLAAFEGRELARLSRLGKRVVLSFEGDLHLVIHLMIAGRFAFKEPQAKLAKNFALAGFDFPAGTLVLTEAGKKRRASLHAVRGQAGLDALDPGGLEVLDSTLDAFSRALTRENHTLKRALTDPHLLSGIGNAYSDEILHHARLSPVLLTSRLSADALERLYRSTLDVLRGATARLVAELGDGFPDKVTAFRPEMAVHGRYGKPCPTCGHAVQRIVSGAHETNYCPTCQNEGRVLADRALSKLLKADWPRTVEELEARRGPR
jgi:formamidopyrimidine-DNA glycosylase